MSLIDCLYNINTWIGFYEYRVYYGHINEKEHLDFHKFIRNKEYIPILDKINNGESFSIPTKKYVNKIDSNKKGLSILFQEKRTMF